MKGANHGCRFGCGLYDPAGVLQNVVVQNGVATSGTLTNYKGVVRNHVETSEDDLKTVSLH